MAKGHKSASTRQHYVPRFLLRGFANPHSDQLWFFNKATDDVTHTSVKNVAVVRGFYDLKRQDQDTISLDPSLTRLEDRASKLVQRIRTTRSLSFLSADERRDLAFFALVQDLRTEAHRRRLADLSAKMDKSVRQMAAAFRAPPPRQEPQSEEMVTALFLGGLTRAHEMLPHMLDKSLLLFESPPSHDFLIGDSPITKQNQITPPHPHGNIGFAVKGIEIYMPISPRLTLSWCCGSYEEIFRSYLEAPRAKRTTYTGRSEVESFVRAMDRGEPIMCVPANVLNLNSLQVLYAETFVFANRDDFGLVRDMIRDNPKIRRGRRGEVITGSGPVELDEDLGQPRSG
jgi:hypothetical protein